MPGADLLSSARTLVAFARTRWGRRYGDREVLLRHRDLRLERFLRETLPRAPFYRPFVGRPLAELPIVDKGLVLRDFTAFNTRGVSSEQALAVALEGERSRDFRPTLGGVTVGLSSGTSGTRGVFLVGPEERARWAGLLLARVLSSVSLRRLFDFRRPPLRVAFFLRANSNLYETVGSRRLRFAFHDLLDPFEEHLERLRREPPDLLVAPPTVLRRLAEAVSAGELGSGLGPLQVISVAEVLEPDDERAIRAAFGVPVGQVYQCTEGFLGVSCAEGRIHLNEEDLLVEPEWLEGEEGRRFQPLITDFSRTTQLVVRYRLDDVLRLAEGPCPCGRASLGLEAIEGRADDVLWLRPLQIIEGDGLAPVFPDLVRRAMALADPGGALHDYRIEGVGEVWIVRLDTSLPGEVESSVRRELERLADPLRLRAPNLRFEPWLDAPLHEKRRRIRCLRKPEGS